MKMNRKTALFKSLPAVAGLLAVALSPTFMQAQAPGKIRGHVTNPTGQPQDKGTVSLSTDGGNTLKYTFQVDSDGHYSGEAVPGTYDVVYRAPDTPPGKIVDIIKGVEITADRPAVADLDMSREEYIDRLPPDQKKEIEELMVKNAEAIAKNRLIAKANSDLKQVSQYKKDIDAAWALAQKQLGPNASRDDVTARENEVKAARYASIETLMTNDIKLLPTEARLWSNLAYAQAGEQRYDDAIASYKKAIDLGNAAESSLDVVAVAEAGLGEAYARTGRVAEANAAYDRSAKDDPTHAAAQLRNQAIVFYQMRNNDAQVAAADEAMKANPSDPILYYIKGVGLCATGTIDSNGVKVPPPDCIAAYQKYLELAPNGQFAGDVAGTLKSAGQKVPMSYDAGKNK